MIFRDIKRAVALGIGLLVAIAVGGTAGCGRQEDVPATALATPLATPQAAAPVPVVIYLIDTLRADRLGVYGYDRPTSPHLDALAAESVVFEQAYAAAPWTLPSVASLFTSTFVCEHALVKAGPKLNPALPTLAERLAARGYASAAFYTNPLLGPVAGLTRGFGTSSLRPTNAGIPADAAAWLDQRDASQPWFLYLHTMEPHQAFLAPYAEVKRFGHVPIDVKVQLSDLWFEYAGLRRVDVGQGKLAGTTDTTAALDKARDGLNRLRPEYELLYAAAVREADGHLGAVIADLKRRKLWDQTLFIVLADHGEEFGEHGLWFHEQSVYDAVLRVPLLIHFPRGQFAGRRVADVVSLVDVLPTIGEVLGVPEFCAGCRGVSLVPLLTELPVPRRPAPVVIPALRVNATSFYRPWQKQAGDVNVVVREGPFKAIFNEQPGSLELYDLALDPNELKDQAAVDPARAVRLREAAGSWLKSCRRDLAAPEPAAYDEPTKKALRALGYLN